MNIIKEYDRNINYIGNAEWIYNITKYIYRKWSGINYTAYWHDIFYKHILHKEHGIINRVLLKILLDLVFLVMGFFRCLFNFQVYGCVAVIGLYLVLLCHTPFYIYNMYKNTRKTTKSTQKEIKKGAK